MLKSKARWHLRLKRFLHRIDFTLRSALAAIVLFLLFAFAIVDFVITASHKEYQIQESVLRGELGQFLLNTREPDGSSLLENPVDFTKSKRAVQIVSVHRPFFAYLVTKRNSRTFNKENLRLDLPRSCVLEFLSKTPSGLDTTAPPIQICFAAIPADPSGRYVYFAIRYPSSAINRHIQGEPFENSDRLELLFQGQKEVRIALTFQEVPQSRGFQRVTLTDRFDGIHEMAAYLPDEGGRPTRLLNAQAFEQKVIENDKNLVTVLGRLDISLLDPSNTLASWPSAAVKAIKIGVEVIPASNIYASASLPHYKLLPGEEGLAQLSLEQAYRLAVPSKAALVVTALGKDKEKGKVLWTSDSLDDSETRIQQGLFQRFANRVARLMITGVQKVSVTHDHRLNGLPPLTATLTEDANIVPDIAARSLAWQFAAIVVIALFIWILWGGSMRLERLTRSAYKAAASRSGSFAEFANSTDQIGTLGRVLHLLFKRDEQRLSFQRKRLERENQQKADAILKERELLKTRQEILQAIGHEIRSPLANLLASQKQDPVASRNLSRMERAVNALQEAATIEEGLLNGVIAARVDDLGEFISKYTDNLRESGKPIKGYGARLGVTAYFDDIVLETILDHLLDNALRHSNKNSIIEVEWMEDRDQVIIEVRNNGEALEDCENIFKLGVSDPATGGHLGLGLYAARMYLLGMKGFISAENRADSVAFILRLQKEG